MIGETDILCWGKYVKSDDRLFFWEHLSLIRDSASGCSQFDELCDQTLVDSVNLIRQNCEHQCERDENGANFEGGLLEFSPGGGEGDAGLAISKTAHGRKR